MFMVNAIELTKRLIIVFPGNPVSGRKQLCPVVLIGQLTFHIFLRRSVNQHYTQNGLGNCFN